MNIRIHCITNLTGFPNGTAGAHRIRMYGKAIINSGIFFKVYTNCVALQSLNNDTHGIFDGIPYTNLYSTSNLVQKKFIRTLMFIKGLIIIFSLIFRMNRKEDIIFIHSHGSGYVFNLSVLIICKIYRIKVVQEINEWFHNDLKRTATKYFTEGPILKMSTGVIAISESIKSITTKLNPKLKTIIVPILGEPIVMEQLFYENDSGCYCFWMGMVNGYIDDILIIIKACGLSYQKGHKFSFIISGPYSNNSLNRIFDEATQCGFPLKNIQLLGYISDNELNRYCRNAFFFVIPLWNTERSSCRFPTKIATFMFSGKPIITCKIGSIGKMLHDRENVLFYHPGDEKELADRINILFEEKELYTTLCLNTYKFAMNNFFYKNYTETLNRFFNTILLN